MSVPRLLIFFKLSKVKIPESTLTIQAPVQSLKGVCFRVRLDLNFLLTRQRINKTSERVITAQMHHNIKPCIHAVTLGLLEIANLKVVKEPSASTTLTNSIN